jgi:predicted dehydrogenase
MAKVGIIGLGFIGKVHLATLRKADIAEVVAVADKNPANLPGESGLRGNIAVESDQRGLEGVDTYPDGDTLLHYSDADVVLIALPTHLHYEFVLKAFGAGKHVICEKPLSLNPEQGAAIVAAAEDTDRSFFVAHCIRFWPAYEKARALMRDSTYGRAFRAHFWRTSPKPTWSWENWLLDESKSGGCALDLHIHDVDYVNDLFGAPSSVSAAGIRCGTEGVGDIMSTYLYDDGLVVTIEGGWEQHSPYPFRMGFRVACEGATIEYNSLQGSQLNVYEAGGEAFAIDESTDDGYIGEHRYFFECIQLGQKPALVTPRSSLEAVELVERELKSMR